MAADTDRNIGAVLHGPFDFRLEPRRVSPPSDFELQYAVHSVGICGSDIHFYAEGSIGGMFPLKEPVVMGHESSGVVTAVGKHVDAKGQFKVGDRIAVEPNVPCRRCEFCHVGRYNLCPEEAFFATPPTDGALQHFVNIEADFCFKIPDSMTDDEAALVEPFAVAIGAVRKAGVVPGSSILIHGAGPVGLCLMLTAKASGASTVIITDINKSRLDFATKMGATDTLLLEPPAKLPEGHAAASTRGDADFYNQDAPARKLAGRVRESAKAHGKPKGLSICFDTTGVEMLQVATVHSLAPSGVLMLVGYHHQYNRLPVVDLICKEIDIRSIFRYNNTYQAAVDLVASKKFDVEKLVSHRFPLREVKKAFETARNAISTGANKVIIDCRLGQ